MAEDQDKKDEQKLEFSPEGEFLGYISLDQAQVLAWQTARETPGAYGSRFDGVPMAFDVVESEETEDHYVITLSFRPQGEFFGKPGREQLFITKEGTVAARQVVALPRQSRRIPILPAAIGLAVVGAIVVAAVFFLATQGQNDGEERPTTTSAPTFTQSPPFATAHPNPTVTTEPRQTTIVAPANTPGITHQTPMLTQTPQPQNTPEPDLRTAIPPEAVADMSYRPVKHDAIFEISTHLSVAQTFTASGDGEITKVEIVGISRHGCASDESLEVRLLATDGGAPADLVFYSRTFRAREVPVRTGNLEGEFDLNG